MQLSKNPFSGSLFAISGFSFHSIFPSLHAAAAVVDPVGLEPTTPALSRRCSNQLSYGSMIDITDRAAQQVAIVCSKLVSPGLFLASVAGKSGGMGIRTPDIQLAKLALYQLSYTPLFSKNGCKGARRCAGGVEEERLNNALRFR